MTKAMTKSYPSCLGIRISFVIRYFVIYSLTLKHKESEL